MLGRNTIQGLEVSSHEVSGRDIPDLDVVVNGAIIPAAAVAAEMQHHPADSAEAAWHAATRALVIRALLREAADGGETDEEAAIDALLAREIHLPEADEAACRRWHAAHPERFGTAEWWEASHILLAADPEDNAARNAAEARARSLLEQVLAVPGSLPELAARHSDCPSREQGGSLGRIVRGTTVPEFETFLAGLAPNQVCPLVVKSRYGMHVVHLHRHAPRRDAAYADVAAEVARDLRHVAWKGAVRQYIASLAAHATIEGFSFEPETAMLARAKPVT
jgi:peptidyl-prolyl cis-trans isomerase C